MKITTNILITSLGLLPLVASGAELNIAENNQFSILPTVPYSTHLKKDGSKNEFLSLMCPKHESALELSNFVFNCWECKFKECEQFFKRQPASTEGSCWFISLRLTKYLPMCNSCNGPVQAFESVGLTKQSIFFCSKCQGNNKVVFPVKGNSFRISLPINALQKIGKGLLESNSPCPTPNCKGKLRTDSFELDKKQVKLQFCDKCDEVPYTDKAAAKEVLINTKINGEIIPKEIVAVISKYLAATKILLDTPKKLLQ